MAWAPDADVLRGRVAVGAGATRCAGGIAAALGEAAATVICTGRGSATRTLRSDDDRAETIAATAELAADPDRARWNRMSLSSGGLAAEDGFTDLDGTRPDIWPLLASGAG